MTNIRALCTKKINKLVRFICICIFFTHRNALAFNRKDLHVSLLGTTTFFITKFSPMTLIKMILIKMTLSIMPLGIMMLNKMTPIKMTLIITVSEAEQWKGINCKQSTSWQHLSRLKASAFFSLQIFLSCFKTQQLILGTGIAIWWLTEPHWHEHLLV